MKCLIELKDVGRFKVNRTIETTADSMTTAEYLAVKEAKNHLISNYVSIEATEGHDYQIYAGGRPVGIAKITLS